LRGALSWLHPYLFLTPRVGTNGAVRVAILPASLADEVGVTSEEVLDDNWHHLAVVFDQTHLSLYVDGWLAGTTETTVFPSDLGVTTQNWLGDSQWVDDDFYMGLMDDFRIYDRALTDGEVRYLAGDR
jgi:hypothetical protein